ncbi:MAG: diaminopropionate ammonia-lyase [Phycisphaerae bacterium]
MDPITRIFANERDGRYHPPADPDPQVFEFHRALPGYAPTPLHRLSSLARQLGVGEVLVKDESNRWGLPAFKILGASWAAHRLILERMGEAPGRSSIADLRQQLASGTPVELITASTGNHGRAVARVACYLGCRARVFVPADASPLRISAIESEGATVVRVNGDYDDAVGKAIEQMHDNAILLQDTSVSERDERSASLVIEGYSTMLREIDDALSEMNEPLPDLVFVQIGVGALAAAVVTHFRRKPAGKGPVIVGVEPCGAASACTSVERGELTTLPLTERTIMNGLSCAAPSRVAWPILQNGVDCFMSLSDDRACEAMRILAREGVVSGESGAAGLGGLLELIHLDVARRPFPLGPETRVLVISTEGATDPCSFERIVGRSPEVVTAGVRRKQE